MLAADPTIDWLLDGDPAVVWQVQRDLLDRRPRVWRAARRRVSAEGWGARSLRLRASDGTWGGGLYSPQWTSTVGVLERRRGSDGRWRAQNKHRGETRFNLEKARQPSRVNTLRALRVLRWVARVRAD